MHVHHVTGLVVGELDVGGQLIGNGQMPDVVLRGQVRRGGVVVPARDVQPHVRVDPHRLGQLVEHEQVLCLELLVRPGMHPVGEHLVRQVAGVAELGPHVVVQRGGVRPDDGVDRRVRGPPLPAVVAVPAGEPAVDPADRPALVPQQLGEESDVLGAQVNPVHVVLGQPGQRRDLGDCGGSLLGVEP